ncbi:MAG: SLOG family protein [Rikenellaceae bacterium]
MTILGLPEGNFTEVRERCDSAIDKLVKDGFDTFVTGMSAGFDMLAAVQVLDYKQFNPTTHVRLVAVFPYVEIEPKMRALDRECYKYIFNNADEVIFLSQRASTDPDFHAEQISKRDEFLLNNSARQLSYTEDIL